MVEILAPAGNMKNFITAVNVGADAVYLGLSDFSARKSSDNFTFEELAYAINYAKAYNVKVYIAVNTLVKDSEIDSFINHIKTAYKLGADAFILQDVFLGKLLKNYFPNIVLHLSTQAGVCNVYGAKMAKDYGFSRVILARETKLNDIKEISSIIQTEVFIQGALCSSLSGHCYFSSFIGGLSGNRGYCKQPCRKKYEMYPQKDFKGYLLSLSDLCVGENIQKLIDLGVSSFKIEGRMRSQEYVASAVKYYKNILSGKDVKSDYINLKKSYNRGNYTKGLAFSQKDDFISRKVQGHIGNFVGKVKQIVNNSIKLDEKTTFTNGDSYKILRNGYEVGNSIYKDNKLIFKGNVKFNDEVYITKDVTLSKECSEIKRGKIDVNVDVLVKVGEKLTYKIGDLAVSSNDVLSPSKTSPLKREDFILALNKTDVYPYRPIINFVSFDDNVFAPKSVINNLRVELYSKYFDCALNNINDNIEKYENNSILETAEKNETSIISNNIIDLCDNLIYLPNDYNNIDFNALNKVSKKCKIWLYLPAFLSGDDVKIIDSIVDKFYGVYCDGYFGIEYAKQKNLKIFVGVGINVFNSYDYTHLKSLNIDNISASKELSSRNILSISNNLSVLSCGDNALMNLIYCPFDKKCNNCLYKDKTIIKDENGYSFRLFRYKISECRFMLFNCARILTKNILNNEIFAFFDEDYNLIKQIIEVKDLQVRKNLIKNYTYGNYLKGVL